MKFQIIRRKNTDSYPYALYADGDLVSVYSYLFFARWKARRMAKNPHKERKVIEEFTL